MCKHSHLSAYSGDQGREDRQRVFRRGMSMYATQYPHAKGKDYIWTWENHWQGLPMDANFIRGSSSCQVRWRGWRCSLTSLHLEGEACLNPWASTKTPMRYLASSSKWWSCPMEELSFNCTISPSGHVDIFSSFQVLLKMATLVVL